MAARVVALSVANPSGPARASTALLAVFVVAVVVAAAIAPVVAAAAAGGGDSCHLRELDLCAAWAAGVTRVPVTDADVTKHCSLATEAAACALNFTRRCATPVQRELLQFATEGGRDTLDRLCTPADELRVGYLRHAGCLARVQPQGKRCLNDVQAGLERVEKVAFRDRISAACCVYARHYRCVSDLVSDSCGEEAVRYGHIVLRLSTSSLLEVVCQGFDSNPKCDSLLPPAGSKPTGSSKSIVAKLFNAYAVTV